MPEPNPEKYEPEESKKSDEIRKKLKRT